MQTEKKNMKVISGFTDALGKGANPKNGGTFFTSNWQRPKT